MSVRIPFTISALLRSKLRKAIRLLDKLIFKCYIFLRTQKHTHTPKDAVLVES